MNFHRKWYKDTVIAMNKDEAIKPYNSFSVVLAKGMLCHTQRLLSGQVEPEVVIVLLTAPPGVAAFNIQEMTVHSALLLGILVPSLSRRTSLTLRTKVSNLQLLIIDKFLW